MDIKAEMRLVKRKHESLYIEQLEIEYVFTPDQFARLIEHWNKTAGALYAHEVDRCGRCRHFGSADEYGVNQCADHG